MAGMEAPNPGSIGVANNSPCTHEIFDFLKTTINTEINNSCRRRCPSVVEPVSDVHTHVKAQDFCKLVVVLEYPSPGFMRRPGIFVKDAVVAPLPKTPNTG